MDPDAGDERQELLQSYLGGGIGRRVFVKRLLASGVSLAAAVSYADLLAAGTARAAARGSGPAGGRHTGPNGYGFYNFYVVAIDNRFVSDDTGRSDVRVLKRGDRVSWGFPGSSVDHSVTESSGVGYYDSGFQPQQRGWYSMIFPAAGTYRYRCKDPHHASTMTGTVKVPVGRKPVVASAGTQFTISWARAAAQPGYLFDIQFKRPSDSVFKPFRSGITTPSAHFTPSVTGPYQFRARLRNKANGKACGWSPIASISVT